MYLILFYSTTNKTRCIQRLEGNKFKNLYKASRWYTVKTQIRRHRVWNLIMVSTDCVQIIKFDESYYDSLFIQNWLFTGPRSAVGNVSGYRCVSDCRSRGREFDPGPVPYFRGDSTVILLPSADLFK